MVRSGGGPRSSRSSGRGCMSGCRRATSTFLPVPWRKLAIAAAAGVIVLGVALAVMIPRIDAGKERRAELDRARHDRGIAANRVRVNRIQKPRHGAGPGAARAGGRVRCRARGGARAPAGPDRAEDPRRRPRAREIAGAKRRIDGPVTCETMQGTAPGRALGAFDCFVIGHRVKATSHSLPGATGYPFRAVVDFRDFSYAWCKVEQIPGEKLIPSREQVRPLPRDCQAPPEIET